MYKEKTLPEKHISIIVPFIADKIAVNKLVAKINRALLSPTKHPHTNSYEIILVTNSSKQISVENIAINDHAVAVSTCVVSDATTYTELFAKGISVAAYDTIMTLDIDLPLPKHALHYITNNINTEVDVVAAFERKLKNGETQQQVKLEEVSTNALLTIQKNPQAGALIFKKEVWELVYPTLQHVSAHTIEFLYKASEAGFKVARYDLLQETNQLLTGFARIKQTIDAALFVSLVKVKSKLPFATPSSENDSMINAGVRYKKKQFITHSTLSHKDSAIMSFTLKQKVLLSLFALCLGVGFIINSIFVFQAIIMFLSILYLIDVFFNMFIVQKAIRGNAEITFTPQEVTKLSDDTLPVYTILCPLYKEAHMLEAFFAGIAKLEWPPAKLDVILLLEEDDKESQDAIAHMSLPSYVRTLVVPASQPQTKPKACNYGLAHARGEYVVIFDAEDIPDPLQLKKAYIAFQKSDRKVVCMQAKLHYHNINQNLLTRFFTAEYAWLFNVLLPGLQALKTIIPLGGTSNHFRKEDLITLNGWDPFNVTEDADLGMRIFKKGFRTAIIDSVTLEEANSNVFNWIRQRSRWVKGYMQTYLVHTREMVPFIRQSGVQALMLHLVIGSRILFIFVNPLLWIVTLAYFTFRSVIGGTIELVYTPFVLYIAALSLVFGNYFYIFGYIIGCVKRDQWGLIKYVYFLPLYLFLISIAGCISFYQLLFKPYYWEKTVHGLHLKQNDKQSVLTVPLPTVESLPNVKLAKANI